MLQCFSAREEIAGTVKLIFQPGEEMFRLADPEECSIPDIWMIMEAVFGGVFAYGGSSARQNRGEGRPVNGRNRPLTINIHGKTAHGAKPNQGIDAVVLSSQFVMAAKTIVSQKS